MTARWREELGPWLAAHHGVVSTAQFRAWGADSNTVSRAVRSGLLVPVCRGVLRSTAHAPTEVQLLVASCFAHPLAAAARLSGCRAWDLRSIPSSWPQVMLPHGCRLQVPGVVVTRCRKLPEFDVVVRPDGLRVTTALRSVFDAADLLGRRRTESVIEQVLARRLATEDELMPLIERLAHRARPGSRTFRAVVGSRPFERAPMHSDLEVRVLREILRQGLPAPVTQFVFDDGTERRIMFDFAWPALRLALEVDHTTWHDPVGAARRDKERDRRSAAHGWHTLRITDRDVDDDLVGAIAEVGLVLRSRSGERA